jgi:hypothetical protein
MAALVGNFFRAISSVAYSRFRRNVRPAVARAVAGMRPRWRGSRAPCKSKTHSRNQGISPTTSRGAQRAPARNCLELSGASNASTVADGRVTLIFASERKALGPGRSASCGSHGVGGKRRHSGRDERQRDASHGAIFTSENDHTPYRLAPAHQLKRLVDPLERHRVRDHRVDLDLPIHVPVHDFRDVRASARAAEG